MIIEQVILPTIMNYYVSADCMTRIKDKLIKNIHTDIYDEHLYIDIEPDPEFYDAMKFFLSKTEKITIVNSRVYEYELDTCNPRGRLFMFNIDNIFYSASLYSIILNDPKLSLKFDLVEDDDKDENVKFI